MLGLVAELPPAVKTSEELPQAANLSFFDPIRPLCDEQNLNHVGAAPPALHSPSRWLVNAVKTLRHRWSPALQHTANLLAAWGGTR